jgi:hypothetical protein
MSTVDRRRHFIAYRELLTEGRFVTVAPRVFYRSDEDVKQDTNAVLKAAIDRGQMNAVASPAPPGTPADDPRVLAGIWKLRGE